MRRREVQRVAALEPVPLALLDEPLEYILADQRRGRYVCAMLRKFAQARSASRADADTVVDFLTRDLPLHRADKKTDLFVLLRKRSLPEDDLGIPLAQLSADCRMSAAESIADTLAALPGSDSVPISKSAAESMLAYAAREQKHLAVEMGIVMAIARIRFTRGDLKALGGAMKHRRGIQS